MGNRIYVNFLLEYIRVKQGIPDDDDDDDEYDDHYHHIQQQHYQ